MGHAQRTIAEILAAIATTERLSAVLARYEQHDKAIELPVDDLAVDRRRLVADLREAAPCAHLRCASAGLAVRPGVPAVRGGAVGADRRRLAVRPRPGRGVPTVPAIDPVTPGTPPHEHRNAHELQDRSEPASGQAVRERLAACRSERAGASVTESSRSVEQVARGDGGSVRIQSDRELLRAQGLTFAARVPSLVGYILFGVCAFLGAVMIGHWCYRRLAERKLGGKRRW